MIWLLLTDFVLRVTLGMTVCMWLIATRQVNSGFFRIHLWVLLGLNTFASLIALSSLGDDRLGVSTAAWIIATAVLSYFGSVFWLYERRRAGQVSLLGVGTTAMIAWAVDHADFNGDTTSGVFQVAEMVTASLLLGSIMSAMFLGHWYLNTPTMQLAPLKRLLVLIQIAVAARVAICVVALAWAISGDGLPTGTAAALLGLRWLAGLLGTSALGWMTWQTLKIPNTQSATGILYVGVIFVFVGELSSQLLSMQTAFLV